MYIPTGKKTEQTLGCLANSEPPRTQHTPQVWFRPSRQSRSSRNPPALPTSNRTILLCTKPPEPGTTAPDRGTNREDLAIGLLRRITSTPKSGAIARISTALAVASGSVTAFRAPAGVNQIHSTRHPGGPNIVWFFRVFPRLAWQAGSRWLR